MFLDNVKIHRRRIDRFNFIWLLNLKNRCLLGTFKTILLKNLVEFMLVEVLGVFTNFFFLACSFKGRFNILTKERYIKFTIFCALKPNTGFLWGQKG